ncbi:MAG: S41 family peptidase [Thermoanaerobaculia bacterium]|nr:S41 family peptidase [Thermoanaerobaculia bacterium]
MSPRIIALVIGLGQALSALADGRPSPEKPFPAEVVRADFAELYDRLRESHFDLYARRPKSEYDALYAEMQRGFDRALELPAVQQAFQRFVAFGRVAHARIDEAGSAYEAFRAGGGKALALRIRVVAGKTYVVRNLSGNERIAAGDELIALDGQPLAEVLDRLGRHVSADNDYLRDTLFEMRFPALVWQEWGERASFRVTIGKPDGTRFDTEVLARSRAEAQAFDGQQPAALELDWSRREAKLLPDGVAYLRPGPFYDDAPEAANPWDPTSFVRFLDDAFERFLAAGATRLLIDLRDNPGGDNSFSDPMVAWFADEPFGFTKEFRIKVSRATTESNAKRLPQSPPGSITHQFDAAYRAHQPGETFVFDLPAAAPRPGKRFTGRVYLLVNRHSYSNTATVAALAQDYGFAQILGEETSDLATTYGAMESFELSRTGITVGYPKARILRPSGKLDDRGVVPDVAIPTPVVETPDDPVLERALAIVRKKPE